MGRRPRGREIETWLRTRTKLALLLQQGCQLGHRPEGVGVREAMGGAQRLQHLAQQRARCLEPAVRLVALCERRDRGERLLVCVAELLAP